MRRSKWQSTVTPGTRRKAQPPSSRSPGSAADRIAAGNKLRDKTPHLAHGEWRAPGNRADPIDILRAADATRVPHLVPLRYGRMLQSPFTFYRGSAAVMAADLAKTPATGIHVQACGDAICSISAASPLRNADCCSTSTIWTRRCRRPWEWDVKRLVASFVLAARANGLSDSDGRDAAVACAHSYR